MLSAPPDMLPNTMTIRRVNLETDYPTLVEWWKGHRSLIMPQEVFPQGWCVHAGGVEIAMSFLYLDVGGKFAVIEWLTTNPAVSFSRTLVAAVRALVHHIEDAARAQGCAFIISFIEPDSGEERLMTRMGYITAPGPGHKTFAKPLVT